MATAETAAVVQSKGPPISAKSRRLTPDRLKIAEADSQRIIHLGHMRPKSTCSSPLHTVPKKGSVEWRPVGDYRALNAQTIKDKYPILCIADFTSELHGKQKFSHIDLVKAYHQSLRMQFVLCNASSTVQRFIDETTGDLPFFYAFVGDLLGAFENANDHLKHSDILFKILNEYGLCRNVEKCQFGPSTMGLMPAYLLPQENPEEEQLTTPTCVKTLRLQLQLTTPQPAKIQTKETLSQPDLKLALRQSRTGRIIKVPFLELLNFLFKNDNRI
ncbi:Transposon Ty3-I Gag-Pol polyprotein like [Argiope bruennichi]|uniref:Transposon Ty3-I Gag-Pol polyprotein like n=1 Tax=Argiope bruennichi TaxID=94029 RepID=A0A8T0FUU9_ARGBR|nr:Transposon Ty3-I Gag-Pol polyprotein like [Argiope bruennichi]